MTRTRAMADKAKPDQPVESPKLNNTSLQLSTDLDTHITSDTDNRMDFAVGGTDIVHFHPNLIQITSASDGATSQTDLQIIQTTTSPAIYDYGGKISFYHENSAGESINYSTILARNLGVTDGSEEGRIEINLMDSGVDKFCYGLDSNLLQLGNQQGIYWYNFTSTHDGTLTPTTLSATRTWTLPDATGTILLSDGDGSNLTGIDALPSQTSHSGKFLTTDGSSASWATVDALPSQTSHSGKYLTTNGSTASWGTITSGISNVVEDTSPQLGGTLDANSQSIDMGTNLITDTKVGQWDTAYGWGNHASGGYAPLATPTFSSSITATTTVVVGTNGGFYFKQDNSESVIRSESQPIVLQTWESSAWQDRLTVANDGQVAIGTTSPIASHKLTIKETANENASIVFTDTDDMVGVIVGYAKGNNELVSGTTNVDAVLGTAYNSDVHLFTNNAIGLTVQSGGGNPGNVGISTTVPQFKLHVNKGSGTYAPANGIDENIVGFQTSFNADSPQILTFANLDGNWIDGTSGDDSAFGWVWGYQNNVRGGLIYDHRGSERMQMFSSYGAISLITPDSADGDGVPIDSNMNERLVIPPGGNVGIGGDPVATDSGYNNASLHMRGSVTGSQVHFTTPTSGHTASDGSMISLWSDNHMYFTNFESGDFRFYTDGNAALEVSHGATTGTAFVGIGIEGSDPNGWKNSLTIGGRNVSPADGGKGAAVYLNYNNGGTIERSILGSWLGYVWLGNLVSGGKVIFATETNGQARVEIDSSKLKLKSGVSLEFADGTTQSTAASGSGGGITAARALAYALIF